MNIRCSYICGCLVLLVVALAACAREPAPPAQPAPTAGPVSLRSGPSEASPSTPRQRISGLDQAQMAIEVAREQFGEGAFEVAAAWARLAQLTDAQRRLEDASAAYEVAVGIVQSQPSRSVDQTTELANWLDQLAQLLVFRGLYVPAREAYESIVSMDSSDLARSRARLGVARALRAEGRLDPARSVLESIVLDPDDLTSRFEWNHERAMLEASGGQWRDAHRWWSEALLAAGNGGVPLRWLVRAHADRAVAALRAGLAVAAVDSLRPILARFESSLGFRDPDCARLRLVLARLAGPRSQLGPAGLDTEIEIFASHPRFATNLAVALMTRARRFDAQGKREQGLDDARAAWAMREEIPAAGCPRRASELEWPHHVAALADDLVAWNVDADTPTEAMFVAECFQAWLRPLKLPARNPRHAEAINRERNARALAVRDDIRQIDTGSIDATWQAWRLARADVRRFEETVLWKHPRLVSLNPSLHLWDDESLLQYHVGRDRSFVFVATADRPLEAVELEAVDRTGKLARSLGVGRDGLRGWLEAPTLEDQPLARGHALWEILVPETVRPTLAEKAHVIVVPHSVLVGFPFETLITGSVNAPDPVYWLDSGPTVRYAPSVAMLAILAQSEVEPPSGVMVTLSAPALPGEENTWPSSQRQSHVFTTSLRGVRVAELTGRNATEGELRQLLGRVELLHVATRVSPSQGAQGPALKLSPGSGHEEDNGHLSAFELTQLSQEAALAWLSWPQAGVQGLEVAHAFLSAGTQRVVLPVSEAVDDAAEEVLRRAMLAPEFAQREYAQALRKAKLFLRHDPRWSAPDKWAPWILMGRR